MGKGIFAFETKATAGLNNVAHKTQVARSAAVGGTAKLEWDPDFKLAGKPLQFTLSANEASVLTGPKNLTGVVASAKIKPTNNSSITGKYAVDKKLPSVSAKLDLYGNKLTANRTLTNELKWAKGAPVALESEIHLNDLTKFQVETLGTKVDAVKLTRKSGSSALKLKYAIQSKAPIIGLDTYRGSQKWDFEYNVKTECLDAKVKVYPMTLAAQTFIGKSGIGKGGISYKITAERTVIF